jgi:hypothetical protein
MFCYHSIDLKFLHLTEPFICFQNFGFVSHFSIFASQRSELTQFQSGAQRLDFSVGFTLHRKSMRAPETHGAAKSPRLVHFPSAKIFRQSNICMRAVVGSVRGYNSSYGKSDSPAKLTG